MRFINMFLMIGLIMLLCSCNNFSSTEVKITVSNIEVKSSETVEYLTSFDESSVELVVTYSDGTRKTFKNKELVFDYTSFNNKKIGDNLVGVKVKDEDISAVINVSVTPKDNFSLLMIGNSFSDDTIQWVYEICHDLGIDVHLANLYIGGCSVDTHYNNFLNFTNAYEYRTYNANSKTWNTTRSYSIDKALDDYEWDFVSLQQASGFSGQPGSYSNLASLVENILAYSPEVKMVWNMTWAYQQNSTHNDFKKYNNDQLTMYNAIVNTVKDVVLPMEEFELIIPNGTAVQNARTSFVGDNLTRDGYHLTYDLGRYIAGLTLVAMMTGQDISTINYAPSGINKEYKKIAIESVVNAIKDPFNITDSLNTTEPTIDLTDYIKIDYMPVASAYYNSTDKDNYDKLITAAGNSMNFIASRKFTKNEIPVGSIIEVKSGYQYRPEGWVGDKVQTSRPDNVSTRYVEVTDSWWGNYDLRAFNISKTSGASLASDFKTAMNAFNIYVPKAKYNESLYNLYSYDDTNLFASHSLNIADYVLYDYAYSNGFYDSSNYSTMQVVFSDTNLSPKFICTESFTIADLPFGAILIVDEGYQYRPDGWIGSNKNPNRPGNITTNFVVIDENWWGEYTQRGFNISKVGLSIINQNPNEVASHFRIYFPKDNI